MFATTLKITAYPVIEVDGYGLPEPEYETDVTYTYRPDGRNEYGEVEIELQNIQSIKVLCTPLRGGFSRWIELAPSSEVYQAVKTYIWENLWKDLMENAAADYRDAA